MITGVQIARALRTRADAGGTNAYYHASPLPAEGSRTMSWRAVRVLPWLLGVALSVSCSAGCGRSAARGSSPDFAGEWDVTFDDSMGLELRLGGQVQRTRLAETGGAFALRDAGAGLELEVDCTRPELVCPGEVWPRELVLTQAPGRVDDEGLQLTRAIAGEGRGRCASLAGSSIMAELATVTATDAVRQEAVALTSGHVLMLYDAGCFAPFAGLPEGAQVVLTTGFTAAKR